MPCPRGAPGSWDPLLEAPFLGLVSQGTGLLEKTEGGLGLELAQEWKG